MLTSRVHLGRRHQDFAWAPNQHHDARQMAELRGIVEGDKLLTVPRHPISTTAQQRLACRKQASLTGYVQRCHVELRHRLTTGIHSKHSAHIHIVQWQQQLEASLAGGADGIMESCAARASGERQVREGKQRARAVNLFLYHR